MRACLWAFLLIFTIVASASAITPAREGGEISPPTGGGQNRENTNSGNSSNSLKSTGDKGESSSENSNQQLTTPSGVLNKSEELHPTGNNPN